MMRKPWVRGEIGLGELQQNPKPFRPIVCAVAYALDDLQREELIEAVDWRLVVVEADPHRGICLRRVALTACGSHGGVAAARSGGGGIILGGRLRRGCVGRHIALRFVSRRDDRIN